MVTVGILLQVRSGVKGRVEHLKENCAPLQLKERVKAGLYFRFSVGKVGV